MKMYVIPTELACNARCAFCITKFRKTADTQFLALSDLSDALKRFELEKIEITGGGEPTLHPDISEVIERCSDKTRTQMYTHGANLEGSGNLNRLETLCVSMAHYDEGENRRIMGVNPEFHVLRSLSVPIKFSLLIHKSGIHTREELLKYLDKSVSLGFVRKVVVRQMFEQDYQGRLNGEFVSSEKLFRQLGVPNVFSSTLTAQGNSVFDYQGLEVEVEYRSCACEMDNPVLHADGSIHRGWSEELYDFNGE